jgi:ADP-ribosylglycohydrolase
MVTTERATAALYGLAIGDALGMPTQMMSRERIAQRYGRLSGFEPGATDHPIAAGMPAGSITDDTEQALLLARHLVRNAGHVDAAEFARLLVAWEDAMRARGSLDLLGPSTRSAVSALLGGASVEEAGRFGTTNGAAMRVTPIGIVAGSTDLEALVDRVVEACLVTHNTGVAIAGASAVAAAVSAGLDGATVRESIPIAIRAAAIGRDRGYWVAAGDVSRRIRRAVGLVDGDDVERSIADVAELVGTSLATQESVPAAFAILALHQDDPWQAVLTAASVGGDTDTIAAMVGAVAGACGGAFPVAAMATVRTVNDLRLEEVAADLVALR